MKKYFTIFKLGLLNAKMFKMDYYLSIISIPIELTITYLFWQTIQNNNSQIMLPSLISYFLFVQILQLGFQSAMLVTYELWNEINEGTIIVWLNRPVYYPLYIFYQKFALFFVHMLRSLLLCIVACIIIQIKMSVWDVVLGSLSACLGYIILFQIQFIIGCLTFWLKKVIVLRDVIMSMLFLLGGIMLPIDLTPTIIQNIAYLTPIPSIYFVSAKIFASQFSLNEVVCSIFLQVFWVALFQILIYVLWKRGTTDKIVQGA